MTMRQSMLGPGPVRVSELAFGAAAIGNLFTPVTDTEAEEAVVAAWECGVRYFDTAPHYGLGLSEQQARHRVARHAPRGVHDLHQGRPSPGVHWLR